MAEFRDSIPPDVVQAVTETVGICDGSVIRRLIPMSPLERRVYLTVDKWKWFYKVQSRDRELRGNRNKLKKEVSTIKAADRILKNLIGPLSTVEGISAQFLGCLAKGELQKIANWLSWWPTTHGRPPELALARCAEALATVFKRHAGKPNWERVGEIMAEYFPEAGPPLKGDLRLWVLNLVRRHRKKNEQLRELPILDERRVLVENQFELKGATRRKSVKVTYAKKLPPHPRAKRIVQSPRPKSASGCQLNKKSRLGRGHLG
jgi:hypothetical protein